MEDHSEQSALHSPKKMRKTGINEANKVVGGTVCDGHEFIGTNNQSVTIVNILRQGIQSKDKNMLENALSHNDIKIIRGSVSQISDGNCLELFEEIMNRIEDNPMKLLELSNWISVLLEGIARQVVAFKGDPDRILLILNQMERLNEIISMRLSYNQDLISLQSTLDIFQHIIEENKLITEMCNKISSESNNALITYQFEADQENDENDSFDNYEDEDEDDIDTDHEDENEDDDDEDDDDEVDDNGNEDDDDEDYNSKIRKVRKTKGVKDESDENDSDSEENDDDNEYEERSNSE
ncbi:Uncharacterized protein GY17_00000951 [Cryptosporidium hominis]|uniref:Small-subunit processome Utp12 domain-containing protein n=1 Tax=Cryptosporidium hominis TaxID=237895 RepID=A0ABX5BIU6_CRYHO|nr:hypothetical protein [Cryptosporidium hominis TU502]PPS98305.1 Uncharacterized protein GY17_00000951 [Cryptosporidium hominis]|eukprot:PPS98305.1 Uncharacterized protein GY17_00000951 [Cryptosporidium hominis]